MTVIGSGRGRSFRRKNGMANIFTGIDATDIEYLSSLAAMSAAGSTASFQSLNLTAATDDAPQASCEVTSLHTAHGDEQKTDDNRDDSGDLQDNR